MIVYLEDNLIKQIKEDLKTHLDEGFRDGANYVLDLMEKNKVYYDPYGQPCLFLEWKIRGRR